MDIPPELLKEFVFRTDIKSIMRALNGITGNSTRLRAIRIDKDGTAYTALTQFDLMKFGLIAHLETKEKQISPLNQDIRVITYDDAEDKITYLKILTNDPKEALLLKDTGSGVTFLRSMIKSNILTETNVAFYQNLLSGMLDSYQLNNGICYLLHIEPNSTFLVNRALIPHPNIQQTFQFYSRLYKLSKNDNFQETNNYVQINKQDLTIQAFNKTSSIDLSQMILPIVHLYPLK